MLAGRRWIIRLDHWIDRALYNRITGRAEDACYILLQAGSSHTIAIVGLIVAIWLMYLRRWKPLAVWVVLLIGCVALDTGLKHLFHRPRPLNMEGWPGWSFPSGHVMAVTAVYGMLAVFIARTWAAFAVVALILITATALLLPGYHFLSDLIAGYLIGATWLAACAFAAHRWYRPNSHPSIPPT